MLDVVEWFADPSLTDNENELATCPNCRSLFVTSNFIVKANLKGRSIYFPWGPLNTRSLFGNFINTLKIISSCYECISS